MDERDPDLTETGAGSKVTPSLLSAAPLTRKHLQKRQIFCNQLDFGREKGYYDVVIM